MLRYVWPITVDIWSIIALVLITFFELPLRKMVLSKSNPQPWLQFFDLKFLPPQHQLKKKRNVWIQRELRQVFILAIIILKYTENELGQVFHIDIYILKIIVYGSIRLEVIGIKNFKVYQFRLYFYYCQSLCY